MEARELRIGNYLNDCEGNLCEVYELGKNSILAPALDKPTTKLPNKPIPLTNYWLLKFGFRRRNVNFLSFTRDGVQINFIDGKWLEYVTRIEVGTVHKLQNLFFNIKEIELQL